MFFLAFSAGGGDPDGPGPGGVGEPACGGKGGGREEEEEEGGGEKAGGRRRRRRNRNTAPQRQCVPAAWKRDHAPGWLRKGDRSVRRPGTFVLRRVPADRTGSGKCGASHT